MSDKGLQANNQASGGADTKLAGDQKTGDQGAKGIVGADGKPVAQQTQGKPGTATILEGSVADLKNKTTADEKTGTDGAVAALWPEDWRNQMAGEDKDLLALTKRYQTPGALASALKNLRTRLDSGEFKKGLAADATEDEIRQYRADNGIPEKAEAYALPKGLEIPEIDKPIIDGFLEFAHKRNYTPAQVEENLTWFYAAQHQADEQKYAADIVYAKNEDDALRAELGKEYRPSLNGLQAFMDLTFGKELTGQIMEGRGGDGMLLGNNATFLKKMIGIMRELNPDLAVTVTTPGTGTDGKSIADRKAVIEKRMREDRDGYYKDEPMQAEYRNLIAAEEKIAARKAA